ncbi:MAG: DUF5034 domain-containing protein [Schleiferiaceae bacterium]|nr:DUF5034 domain-containing protein [Schleiferiaceae bacterium]
MRKLHKLLFLLSLPLLLEVLVACCKCDVIDPMSPFYSNCALTLVNLDHSGPALQEASSSDIVKTAYGIRLEVERRENTCEVSPQSSLFIASAMAYTCQCDPLFRFQPINFISEVTITTVNDFDAAFPAGADISSLFSVFSSVNYTPVSDYFPSPNKYVENLDQQSSENRYDLLLTTPPTIGENHQFTVTLTLSDGRILSETTTPIKFI